MPADSAHDKWWQISEVVFGVPLLIALALQFIVPLSLPGPSIREVVLAAGMLLIAAGLALVILARREFARKGEYTDPGHPTQHIMTSGVFSFSRNPMYLGIVIFLAGVALAADLPWVLVLLVPSLFACQLVLIAPEERYLAAKFGEEYARYRESVERWAGRK
jgi:protein-S-isoprenylcysteine O-methyltransferase Ste14